MARLESTIKRAPLRIANKDFSFSVETETPSQIIWHDLNEKFAPFTNLKVTITLQGKHQQENAALSIAALQIVSSHFPTITSYAVQTGLKEVVWAGTICKAAIDKAAFSC